MMPTNFPNLVTMTSLDPIWRKMLWILSKTGFFDEDLEQSQGHAKMCQTSTHNFSQLCNYQLTLYNSCSNIVVYCEYDLRPAKPCLCDAGVSGTTRSTEVSISAEASTHPGAAVKETAESLRHPYAM